MTKGDKDVVSAIVQALTNRIGHDRFGVWFAGRIQFRWTGSKLEVVAGDEFTLDRIRRSFEPDIRAVLGQCVSGAETVRFRVVSNGARNATADEHEPPVSRRNGNGHRSHGQPAAHRRPRQSTSSETAGRKPPGSTLQFHSFVVGETNRLAHSASLSVVERPGAFSPLFLYGPCGSGKTHLLTAIAAAARRSDHPVRVAKLSSEQFTFEFLEALQGRGLPTFRNKYRTLDVLLIDDVQFFCGKHATIVELQNTMDTLLGGGRQLVFSADRSPGELTGLGADLVARMSGGLVCGIELADMPTRCRILQQLAVRLEVDVPLEVIEMIAASTRGDARELAGAMNRLAAMRLATGQPITLDAAGRWLADILQANIQAIHLADIDGAICDVFGIDAKTLHSQRRSKCISQPRMLAMWLARKYTHAAFSEIGEHFGRRSHSTVISAEKKVERWLADGEPIQLAYGKCDVREAVRRVESQLRTA